MSATDDNAILQAIIDEPDDDTHRLVYADWLEENGQSERAEFIRTSIILDNWIGIDEEHCSVCGDHWKWSVGVGWGKWTDCNVDAKKRLDAVSNWKNFEKWGYHDLWERNCFDEQDFNSLSGVTAVLIRRGFPSAIRTQHDEWITHGKAICSMHPIQRVELTDREPLQAGQYWSRELPSGERADQFLWIGITEHHPDLEAKNWWIDVGLCKIMKKSGAVVCGSVCVFPTKEEAINALSAACIKYAKSHI